MSWDAWMAREDGRSVTPARVRAYDGAGRGRRLRDWHATRSSANAEVRASLEVLRARSRDLARNNPWAAGVLQTIADETVGEGIRPRVRIDGRGNKARVRKVQDQLLWWAESNACDADGKHDLYGLQALIERSRAESGSVLIRRRVRRPGFARRRGLAVPLQIQVLEPDFLDQTKDGRTKDGHVILHGIEYDRRGQVVRYHLHTQHPGDNGALGRFSTQSIQVPASEVLHLYRVDRPGQAIGVPDLAPALVLLRDMHAAQDAALLRMKIANLFAAFVRRNGDELDDAVESEADARLETLEPGIIEYLEQGEDVTFASPPAAQGLGDFLEWLLRALAQSLGLTYEVVSGDYRRVNFSSGRMAWHRAHRTVQRWRRDLVAQVLDPVFGWWLESLWMEAPELEVDGLWCAWASPRRTLVDPAKEIGALESEVRAGLCSWQEAVASLGRDPEETLDEIEAFQRTLDDREVAMVCDARRSPQGTASAASATSEPSEESEEVEAEGDAPGSE